jgi:hypothetical protein
MAAGLFVLNQILQLIVRFPAASGLPRCTRPRVPVSQRLRRELRFTAIMAGLTIAFTLLGLFNGRLSVPFVLVSLLAGVVGGAVLSRTYRLGWDHTANQVVARIDRVGAMILVVYLLLSVARMQSAPLFALDLHLSLAGRFVLTAGMAIGRLLVSLVWIHSFATFAGVRPDQ